MHDHGAFQPASAVSAPPISSSEHPDLDRPTFAVTRRGYESSAVDAHIGRLEENTAALRTALAESERRRAMAEQHALAVEDEIRAVRAGLVPGAQASDTGFGARAERLLRLAESEAEQIRSAAKRSAVEVTQRAMSEAERHRNEARQQLDAESARAEEHAARRTVELRDRENAVRTRIDQARAEAELIRATAQQAADTERRAARAEVAELRDRSAHELRRVRDREQQELARLRDLQGFARLELNRLAAAIRSELAMPGSRPSPRPGRSAGRTATGFTRPADEPSRTEPPSSERPSSDRPSSERPSSGEPPPGQDRNLPLPHTPPTEIAAVATS